MSLSNPQVRTLSKQFVPIIVNSDREDAIRSVMVHRVRDLPTMIFFSSTGTRLFELPYHARFRSHAVRHYMELALRDGKRSLAHEAELQKQAREQPDSLEASDRLESFYKKGYRFDDAFDQARQGHALSERKGKTDGDRRMANLLYYELKLRRFQRAGELIDQFTKRYPKSKYREKVEYYKGLQQFYGPADLDGAAKTWQEQLNKWPDGKWANKGRKMLGKSRQLQKDRGKLGDAFPKQWGGK